MRLAERLGTLGTFQSSVRPQGRLVLMADTSLDLEHLLKLRVVVARFGEMDRAGWWNTKGQLGPLGASVVRRGLPRTHYFAQARSVFAVAAHRCSEVFDPPGSVTLWRLPQEVEEELDARWEHWLDAAGDWAPFFERIAALEGSDLVADLRAFDLVGDADFATLANLKMSAEGRAVPIAPPFSGTDADVTLIALGFARGRVGALAVPYARAEDR